MLNSTMMYLDCCVLCVLLSEKGGKDRASGVGKRRGDRWKRQGRGGKERVEEG